MNNDETGEAIDARALVVTAAESQIGEQDPDKYWRQVCPDLLGHPHTISWCGGFALWALHQAGLCDWHWDIWKGPGTPSGFLYRLRHTADPMPGDLAYFARSQHHAVIARVLEHYVDTIDGNTLRFPREGVTGPNIRKRVEVTSFYSIAQLVG